MSKGWYDEPIRHGLARRGVKTAGSTKLNKQYAKTYKFTNTRTQATAKKVFDKKFKGQPNFMTPNILRYGYISPFLVYELSKGTGITRRDGSAPDVYGVTILTSDGKRTELSNSFVGKNAKKEAENYIAELKRQDQIGYTKKEIQYLKDIRKIKGEDKQRIDKLRKQKQEKLKNLEKGTKQESKEHPSFSKTQARMIASDHLNENPNYYNKEKKRKKSVKQSKEMKERIKYNTMKKTGFFDDKSDTKDVYEGGILDNPSSEDY